MRRVDLGGCLESVPNDTPMGVVFEDADGNAQVVPLVSVIYDERKGHLLFSARGSTEGMIWVDREP